MLKLIGAILIIGSTSLTGRLFSRDLANRPRELQQIQLALLQLETEMNYGLTPLREAFAAIAQNAGTEIQKGFAIAADLMSNNRTITGSEALNNAITYIYSRTAISKSDTEILYGLATGIGKTDLDEQKRYFALANSKLQAAIKDANTEAERLVKPFNYMGLLSGLALVLMTI